MKTVNLTKLAEARAKMTPGDLTHHQVRKGGEIVLDAVFAADGNSIATDGNGNDSDWDPGNAAGIVATHNAAEVLIEVARAALAAIKNEDAWSVAYSIEYENLWNALAKVSL